jgi:hypothetical protein
MTAEGTVGAPTCSFSLSHPPCRSFRPPLSSLLKDDDDWGCWCCSGWEWGTEVVLVGSSFCRSCRCSRANKRFSCTCFCYFWWIPKISKVGCDALNNKIIITKLIQVQDNIQWFKLCLMLPSCHWYDTKVPLWLNLDWSAVFLPVFAFPSDLLRKKTSELNMRFCGQKNSKFYKKYFDFTSFFSFEETEPSMFCMVGYKSNVNRTIALQHDFVCKILPIFMDKLCPPTPMAVAL